MLRHIAIGIEGAVGTITIDRRERFNSLDVETARELRKAGLQMARDSSIRAVVLRGAGGVFCSGADLKDIRASGPSPGPSLRSVPPSPRSPRGEGQQGNALAKDDLCCPSPRDERGERARRADEGARLRPCCCKLDSNGLCHIEVQQDRRVQTGVD